MDDTPAHNGTVKLRPVWRAVRELLLVAVLFLIYKAGRLAVTGRVAEATGNADRVWHLERWLHLPSEASVQHVLLGHDTVIHAINSYYAYVHFPATAACLIWLYIWRPALYRRTRRTLAWLTAAALAVHLTFPLAPPRLSAFTGLLDTGTRYGPSVYGSPSTDTLSNQYAAMPSLHVGWALVAALALISATSGRRRWLWLAHPLITLFVVVATGNHYWLDAIVAVALLLPIMAVTHRTRAADQRPVVPMPPLPGPAPAEPALVPHEPVPVGSGHATGGPQ